MNTAMKQLQIATFGDILRSERLKFNMSYSDVAPRAGVSRDTVKQWEENKGWPDRAQLKRLFGSFRRLRHFVHLLPQQLANQAQADASNDGEALPSQLAPVMPAPEPPARTFGGALRLLRLEEGLSQTELGELVGVVGTAVTEWERDGCVPVQENYDKLLELLPKLALAARPDSRDIAKPVGRAGRRDESAPIVMAEDPLNNIIESAPPKLAPPGLFEEPMAVSAAPASLASTDQKRALIRWGRLITAIKSSPGLALFTELLTVARDAGMSIDDVIEAIGDE